MSWAYGLDIRQPTSGQLLAVGPHVGSAESNQIVGDHAAGGGGRPAPEQGGRQCPIQVNHVNHAFKGDDGRSVSVLNDISLEVREGELAAIIGPSGCGKTTLLNLISGLEPLTDGEILVNGQPPRAGAQDVAYMFARDVLLPWRTAIQNVELPLRIRGVDKEERLRRAHRALDDVGLGDFTNAYRSELSQGMRQRLRSPAQWRWSLAFS